MVMKESKYIMNECDVLIAGCGVSGMLMAQRLLQENYPGAIYIIDKKKRYDIVNSPDDVPYFFNRMTEIYGLNLVQDYVDMSIWDDGMCHINPTDELSLRYSNKILGQACNTTVSFVNKRKKMYVPENYSTSGIRHTFINILYRNIKDRTHIIFEQCINCLDLDNKCVLLENGQAIKFKYLISTIALPHLLELDSLKKYKKTDLVQQPFYMSIITCKPTSENRVIYCSDPDIRFSRCCLINNLVFVEAPHEFNLKHISPYESKFLKDINLEWIIDQPKIEYKWINPGRFIEARKDFYNELCQYFNKRGIFLLGRYGTWRFKLTEDVWDDTTDIANLICCRESL
jgi:hypothetical protein